MRYAGGIKMKETKIFSKNSIFQKFEVLKTNRNKRYRYNEFLVEGVRSLNEAVKNNWKINSFLYDKNNAPKDMIPRMGSNNVRIKPTINRKIASPALNTLQRAKIMSAMK